MAALTKAVASFSMVAMAFGQGGGSGAPTSTSSKAASMLGNVGTTTVAGTIARTGTVLAVGQDIYGPFEAGFTSRQDSVLTGLGCSTGSLGYLAGGIDTSTAEQMVAFQCSITLPRVQGGSYISLLDECGGHTRYHFHERLSCLYNITAAGHSTKVGQLTSSQSLYGKWENTNQSPQLDACGGHWGATPDSSGSIVYHYHVQDSPPFTVGCFGPNDDGSLVTVQQCRSFYTGCDGVLVDVTTPSGRKQYDLWCPCWDANVSNTGVNIVALPATTGNNGTPPPGYTTTRRAGAMSSAGHLMPGVAVLGCVAPVLMRLLK